MRSLLPLFRVLRPGVVMSSMGTFLCLIALVAAAAAQAPPSSSPSGQSSPAPSQAGPSEQAPSDSVTEDQFRQLLVGKSLYLRGGYLDTTLSFDQDGRLIGHSPQGSFTLNLIQIDKIHLERHKLELEGTRYGLHFLGQSANEDPTKAVDRVRITPKKKILKITIERQQVIKLKKKKKGGPDVPDEQKAGAAISPAAPGGNADAGSGSDEEIPASERGATTTSPVEALKLLKEAVGNVLSVGLDDRLVAAMPDYWKLYYQAAKAHTNFHPAEPGVLLDSDADQKAKLLSNIEAPSNEYAQANGVAGMALYHAVISADGKPEQIVVGRPIGFGLDENAVETIRKASFQPAMKDGKPVPVVLDLLVQFRIFSKRTSGEGEPDEAKSPSGPILPGPYSVNHP